MHIFCHWFLITNPTVLDHLKFGSWPQAIVCWTQAIDFWAQSNWVKVIVFNATFNNISVISWRSVSLVEETGVPGENHRPAAGHWQI